MRKTETFTLKISFDVRGEDRFSGRAQHVRTGEKIVFKDMEVLKDFLILAQRRQGAEKTFFNIKKLPQNRLKILRGDLEPGKDPLPSPKIIGKPPSSQRRNEP